MNSVLKPMPEWDAYYSKNMWKYLDDSIKYLKVCFDGREASLAPYTQDNESCELKFKPGCRTKFDMAFDTFLHRRKNLFGEACRILSTECSDFHEYGLVLSRHPMEGCHSEQASTIAIFADQHDEGEIVKPTTAEDGFQYVWLRGQRILYHELIWSMHHDREPRGPIVHKDGDKTNNRIDNLEERV